MKDNLGLFGHPEDNTGEFNVEELRAALARNPRGTDQQTLPRQTPTRERRARRLADDPAAAVGSGRR